MSDFAPDDPAFYLGDPHAVFGRLRREDPLPWYPGSGGAWCVLKHADVMTVSRDPQRFTSTRGVQIGMNAEARPAFVPPTILEMDPPQHNQHRKLVIAAFTPRAAKGQETMVRQIARECLDAIEAGGGRRSAATDAMLGEMLAYFASVLAERRRAPKDDLVSKLAFAEIEGDQLTDPEILMFCITLLAAGNETTRNLISGGSLLLMREPEQKQRLLAEPALLPNAIEEMLRWWTPVQSFIRTATRDTEMRGKQIAEGDVLLLLYASANRDEDVWGGDADRFDIGRDHAHLRHLAFGFGEHLCLGAPLARLEARVLFEELLARFPHFELAGEPELLHSRLMRGVERLPVRFQR